MKNDPSHDGLLAIGDEVGGFRVTGVIRSGQSNNVYAALSPDGLAVAMKEYFPRKLAKRLPSGRIGVADERAKRQFEIGVKGFVNEAVALAEIRSELLAQYVTSFRENGTAYLMTALEPGQTLEAWARQIVKAGKHPDEGDLRYIFWSLLHAVQVMHDRGFLHLDIKPSNVIMRDENTPILIDLGGARRFPRDPRVSSVSVSNFTPGFAAPEQHTESLDALGPATDIYGIGASILYCMSGRLPPVATDRMPKPGVADPAGEMLAKCTRRYSKQLIEIVQGCLALDLSERYDNVRALQNLISSR